jgi:MFS family permease
MMATITMLFNSNALGRYQVVSGAGLILCFAVATWVFWRQEKRIKEPMIRLSLFRIRNFGFGTAGAAFNYLCFFLVLYLLPFYFNTVRHASAAVTGDYLTIAPLVMMICAPVAGALSDKMNSRIIITSGMVMSVISLLCFAWMGVTEGRFAHSLLVVGLLFTGLGTGWFAAPNNSAILGAAPRSEQGVASGTLATFRYVGMMAGITVGGSLFDTILGAMRGSQSRATNESAKVIVLANARFLEAFVIVMLIGAMLGVLGVVSSLMMRQRLGERTSA